MELGVQGLVFTSGVNVDPLRARHRARVAVPLNGVPAAGEGVAFTVKSQARRV
jgi:hypothetical protein